MEDVNDYLIFAELARAGSITEVARKLGLPKSTISRRLANLEERIGSRLINRTTRSQALTELGQAYLEYCERLAQDVADVTAFTDSVERQSARRAAADHARGILPIPSQRRARRVPRRTSRRVARPRRYASPCRPRRRALRRGDPHGCLGQFLLDLPPSGHHNARDLCEPEISRGQPAAARAA